jgi:hypothetical protein
VAVKKKASEEKKPVVKKVPKGELVSELLTFDLTQSEVAEKGGIAADQSAELSKITAEFKAVRSEFKGKIDGLAKELNATLCCIKKGSEEREVECTKVFVKDQDLVQFWYEGKMLKERPALDTDRQKAMPFLRKKKEEAEAQTFNGMVIDHKMAAAGDKEVH